MKCSDDKDNVLPFTIDPGGLEDSVSLGDVIVKAPSPGSEVPPRVMTTQVKGTVPAALAEKVRLPSWAAGMVVAVVNGFVPRYQVPKAVLVGVMPTDSSPTP